MSTNIPRGLFDHFVVIEDTRDEKKRRHFLVDLLVIAINAMICGADGWTRVAAFGKAKEAWLRGFLELLHGIPSHDTFGRVFSVLSPEVFEARFREWVASVREVCGEDIQSLRSGARQLFRCAPGSSTKRGPCDSACMAFLETRPAHRPVDHRVLHDALERLEPGVGITFSPKFHPCTFLP